MGKKARYVDPRALDAAVEWFASLSPESRETLLRLGAIEALEAGETLFETGDRSDALYVVVSGSLGAFTSGSTARLVGQAVAGQTVGEAGLLTGRTRSATVRALRDSEVLRIPLHAFDTVAGRDPEAVRAIARLALERVGESLPEHVSNGPRTLAVLPQSHGFDERAFAERLARELSSFGRTTVVDETMGSLRDASFFASLESHNRFVVYVAPRTESAFRSLCLRQADALLFVARATEAPAPWSELVRGVRAPMPRPEHLVLLHDGTLREGSASVWLDARPTARHHHVAAPAHHARLARLLVGKCVTLVLSGGGARGFAHIGVVRALRERGVVVDAVGGTSIGAVVGAGVASEWSIEEMTDVYRRSFVSTNPLSDYTLPLVSMVRGRKVSRLLRQAFGSRAIEDLSLPFFCVSSNLTEGHAAVHRRGSLWRWLRASIAIPGVLPPVMLGGRVYVDGSVINNLPVDVMRENQTGDVIAVDIGGDDAVSASVDEVDPPPWWRMLKERFAAKRRPSIFEVLLRAGMVASGAQTIAARSASSLLLTPPIADVDLLEWKAFDRAIELGYRYARDVLERAALPSNVVSY